MKTQINNELLIILKDGLLFILAGNSTIILINEF